VFSTDDEDELLAISMSDIKIEMDRAWECFGKDDFKGTIEALTEARREIADALRMLSRKVRT
jgi:hypothetical protein